MPLPWKTVNEADSQTVAQLIELPRAAKAEKRKWGCPFCESSDALHAYPGEGSGFGCWAACGADRPRGCRGYSVIDVAAEHWALPPPDACRALAHILDVPYIDDWNGVRFTRAPPVTTSLAPRVAPPTIQEANLAALQAVAGARFPPTVYGDIVSRLGLGSRGRAYLQDTRRLDARSSEEYGFRSLDTPREWNTLARHLLRTYSPEELAAAGFPLAPRGDTPPVRLPFNGRIPALVIPYRRGSEFVGLRFRNTLPDRAEYKHNRYRTLTAAPPSSPFNVDALRGSTVFVVEGELNAETLRQRDLRASGLSGAGAWLHRWTTDLAGARQVVSWFDSQDAKKAGQFGEAKLRLDLSTAFGPGWLAGHYRTIITDLDANALHVAGRLDAILANQPGRCAA